MNGKHRLGMAIRCLHISTIAYVLAALCILLYTIWTLMYPKATESDPIFLGLFTMFCFAMAIVPEIAVLGIRRRRFWGWVLGLILFATFVPSIFLPLGVFGLWGLLDANSRAEFGMNSKKQAEPAG
jgi:hypothetical protein